MKGEMRIFSAFFGFLVVPIITLAQIPVGNWRQHLPSNNAFRLACTPTKVYCTSGESLFSYNLNDNSVEKLSKITGLSDFGISTIAYSEEKNVVVIGYENGNIDILKGKNVINISDLKKKTIAASKSINHIFLVDKWAYLSCGFGIILLDLEKEEIKDTYVFGPSGSYIQVNSCTSMNNSIYAATSSGIYKAEIADPLLVDYSHWSRITDIPNFNKSFLQVVTDNNTLYAIYSNPVPGRDSVYYLVNDAWESIAVEENTDIFNISFSNDQIFLSTTLNLKIYNKEFQLIHTQWQYQGIGNARPRHTYKDDKGNLWIADFENGLVEQRPDGSFNQIMPNGPVSSHIKSFHYSNNRLYAAAGGTNVSYDNLYNGAEFSVFENEE